MNCIYRVEVSEYYKTVRLIRGKLIKEFELNEGWVDRVTAEIGDNLRRQFSLTE